MTNYIIPSSTQAGETIDFTGVSFPCRITDLRDGSEYILETAEGSPIAIGTKPDEAPTAGDTDNRPEYTEANGKPYLDTTIGKPIWFNGTVWIDANGNDVDNQEG
jgi:hypothetical protein